MESAFGRKLFQIFLLFALVPSVILALFGYYLATDSGPAGSPEVRQTPAQVNDYYTAFLFGLIERSIGPDGRNTGLDFSMVLIDSAVLRSYPADFPQDVRTQVSAAAIQRPRGFVETGGRIYQYVCRHSADTVLYGGIIHDPPFAQLSRELRTNRAVESSLGALKQRYVLFLGLVFAAALVLAIVSAYVFSTRLASNLARPITDLTDAAGLIADGDFSPRVEASGPGEVKILIARFNQMARQLKTTTGRLAQVERVAAWQHIARRFAHELKNPLQPMTVSVYQIRKALAGSAEAEKIQAPLSAVSEELKHLTELAERFSSLAKLPPPDLRTTDLRDLLLSVAELYRERLDPFEFHFEGGGGPVKVRMDPAYFREALHNLLQNAIDASQPGSYIGLTLRRDQDQAVVTVADRGTGMSEETLESARMPYFTTKSGGSGIGLAVVEKTVSEIGGQLDIVSRPDRGTEVTMRLPLISEKRDG